MFIINRTSLKKLVIIENIYYQYKALTVVIAGTVFKKKSFSRNLFVFIMPQIVIIMRIAF